MRVYWGDVGYNCRYLSTEFSRKALITGLPERSRWSACRRGRRVAMERRRKHWIMQLDLPTLMVMQSFAMACAGTVLLVAWSQNRKVATVGLWGLANVLAGGGIL